MKNLNIVHLIGAIGQWDFKPFLIVISYPALLTSFSLSGDFRDANFSEERIIPGSSFS